jgi:hypothetical protein
MPGLQERTVGTVREISLSKVISHILSAHPSRQDALSEYAPLALGTAKGRVKQRVKASSH